MYLFFIQCKAAEDMFSVAARNSQVRASSMGVSYLTRTTFG